MKFKTVGERLKQRRKELHLTQAETAERIGVRRETYKTWELGQHRMRSYYLPDLAAVLDLPLDELEALQNAEILEYMTWKR